MRKYMKRCQRAGQVAVMEVRHGVVRTIAMEVTSSGTSKRRKVDSQQLLQLSSSNVQLVNQYRCLVNLPENSISPTTSGTSDHVPTSLKVEGFKTEISMFINAGFSRETSLPSEFWADSDGMESSTTNKKPSPASSRRKSLTSKMPMSMPSTAEIEEFFSAAEKCEQKRFADKYNYDIGKDEPLEGKYHWVRLKP